MTLSPHRSPAHWFSYPRRVADGFTRVRAGEQTVLLDENGQRWTLDDGRALGAPSVAPEPLVGAGWLVPGPGVWFVSESGTTYTAPSWLGELTQHGRPPAPFVRLTSAPRGLLGITGSGQMRASFDYGVRWVETLPGETVVDVALLTSGDGLAILSPERVMTTNDFGHHWQPLGIEPLGATHVLTREPVLELLTLLGRYTWTPGKPLAPIEPAQAPEATAPEAFVMSEVRANAGALANRSAALVGRNYYEVEGSESSLVLWSGDVEKPLTKVDTSVRKCRLPYLLVGQAVSYLMCFSQSDRGAAFKLFKSEDGGKIFEEQPLQLYGVPHQVRGVVWHEQLVLSGICPPDSEAADCVAKGAYVIPRHLKSAKEIKTLALPVLSGAALALSVAPSTGRLFVVGAHRKGGQAALFSATSWEGVFGVSLLANLQVGLRRGEPLLQVTTGNWSQEGYGAFVFDSTANANVLVIVDENGHVVQTAAAPNTRATVTSVGLRALAIDARLNKVWESIDGGATWRETAAPAGGFCDSGESNCNVTAACYDGGCLASERWLRAGWGGAAPGVATHEPTDAAPRSMTRSIVCKIADEAQWRSGARGELPDASRASLNGVDWFSHAVDWTTASVHSYEMPVSTTAAPSARRDVLFEPRSDANQWAVYSSHQTEGVVALRARADSSVVEVAWRNLFSGTTTHRARLRDAEGLVSSATRFSSRAGQPGLVSVAQGGVFVRLGQNERSAPTYFIRENGELEVLPPLGWPATMEAGRTEMATIDNVPVALKLFRGGSMIARAHAVQDRWVIGAMSIGLDERVFDIKQSFEFTYAGARPSYYLWQQTGSGLQATLFPMQANGAVLGSGVPAPTQQDLNRSLEPALCTEQTANNTPRIVAASERGLRYRVLVEHSSEPQRVFMTNFAVMHGSVDDACVAAFDAESLSRTQDEEQRVLVRPEPGRASWLFRRVSGTTAFDYRSMDCRYESSASAPNESSVQPDVHL